MKRKSISELVEILRDSNGNLITGLAIELLVESKDPEAIELLFLALKYGPNRRRLFIASALVAFAEISSSVHEEIANTAIKLIKEGEAVEHSIMILQDLEGSGVAKLLIGLFENDSYHKYKPQIAVALGRLGDVKAVSVLKGCLSETDGQDRFSKKLRAAVAEALGELGDPETFGILVYMLLKEDLLKSAKHPQALKRLFTAAKEVAKTISPEAIKNFNLNNP